MATSDRMIWRAIIAHVLKRRGTQEKKNFGENSFGSTQFRVVQKYITQFKARTHF